MNFLHKDIIQTRGGFYLLEEDENFVCHQGRKLNDTDTYFRSRVFLQTVFNEINETLRCMIMDIIEYIKIRNHKYPYYKKQISFHMSFPDQDSWNKKNQSLYLIFYYLLQTEIPHHFVEPSTSMWHFLRPVPRKSITKGANLKLERKAILSNMLLAPTLITEQNLFHYADKKWSVTAETLKLGNVPEFILYFGSLTCYT